MAKVLAEEVVETPCEAAGRERGSSPLGADHSGVPGLQRIYLKAILKPSESQPSFHHHHALLVLNNVSDQLLPIMGLPLPLLKERSFYLVWCFGWTGLLRKASQFGIHLAKEEMV